MLNVNELHKQYGSFRAVDGISFSVKDHETVGLLGPNGAGKSTTIRMLAGYLMPTSGEIELCGVSMADKPREAKRLIGYLPEIPPLYTDMTVNEHLRFVCSLRNIAARQVAAECGRVCSLLNLSHVVGRMIGHLSKGYRQRVGFAAALVGDPKLLILDEPTVGLDPRQVIEMRQLILDLSKERTVLISSHVLSEIACICTHLLVMNGGRLLANGTPEEITDAYRDRSSLIVTIRGDRSLAAETLKAAVGELGELHIEERARPDETAFVITTPKERPMESTVFHALAQREKELTLLMMQPQAPTLEEAFIQITQGKTPGSLDNAGAERRMKP